MADASPLITNFYGGEISRFAQGRADKPDYRTSLNVCLNGLPNEIGIWTRRPGTQYASHTRRGAPGRVMGFDYELDNAVTLEWTDGFVRFRAGENLISGNDPQEIAAISTASPAVVQTATNHGWSSGNTVIFSTSIPEPLLQRREFLITVIDPDQFSLQDAITGANISGAAFVSCVGSTVFRVQELATVYVGGAWSGIRPVQAETTDILLCPAIPPQVLTVENMPSAGINPVFAITAATFNDGPYLDPFVNGVRATPGALSGIVTFTLSFPTYSATTAYAKEAFVTYSGNNYVSLQNQNVNHQPDISPTYWAVTDAGAAINDGRGFLGTDIGRLVRFLSEPALWNVLTAYVAGNVVSYNPSGEPGAATYWQAKGATTGDPPGADLTNWELVPQGAAIWTWGRIVGLSNVIDRQLAGSTSIGNMTGGGGINAVFDGAFSQSASASALLQTSGAGAFPPTTTFSQTTYVGKNYSAATDQVIDQATVYPSSDFGFAAGSSFTGAGEQLLNVISVTFNLRGKASAPASSSDGTLLGTSGALPNPTAAVTIVSGDKTTAWKYVWVEMTAVMGIGGTLTATSYQFSNIISELSLFNPTGTGTGEGIEVEILGPPLLYTEPIVTWRLGAYSDTTGYPTSGIYHEGRLWLGGAIKNRFDACVSNGINGTSINFAPTNQYGVVAANNAISYTLNSKSLNQITDFRADSPGLLACTLAGEFLIAAPTNGALSPTNIAARLVTSIGSENIRSARAEHTTLFAKRYGRKLIDYFADANFNKPSGQNIADKAEHIVAAGIAEIDYTSSVIPILWGRDGNDALFGVTYKRDTLTTTTGPTFAGFHRHQLGSGRKVESLCIGPSIDGDRDTLTMVTNDPATGIRHVELLTDVPGESAALADAWFLDDAVNPLSSRVFGATVGFPYGGVEFAGFWHLNQETVQVFAAGLDCGEGEGGIISDFVVNGGSVLIPFGDGSSWGPGRGLFTAEFLASISLSQIVVGFTYNSDGQLVRPLLPADTGARTGPALGKTRRAQRYAVLLANTVGISFGTEFSSDNLKPTDLRQANGNPIAALTMFSGVHSDVLTNDYGYDGMVCWRISRPWPANVIAIEPFLQTQDR